MAGLMLKFDPDGVIKKAEERIGRPLTEDGKKTMKSFMLGMLAAGMQMGESYAMPEPDFSGAGEAEQ